MDELRDILDKLNKGKGLLNSRLSATKTVIDELTKLQNALKKVEIHFVYNDISPTQIQLTFSNSADKDNFKKQIGCT